MTSTQYKVYTNDHTFSFFVYPSELSTAQGSRLHDTLITTQSIYNIKRREPCRVPGDFLVIA
jgi:hypothetical protein